MSRPKAKCDACGKDVTVTEEGVLRVHGPVAVRCMGSGEKPLPPAAVGLAEDMEGQDCSCGRWTVNTDGVCDHCRDDAMQAVTGSAPASQPNPYRAPLPTSGPGGSSRFPHMLSEDAPAAQPGADEADAWLGGGSDSDEADAWLDGPAGGDDDRSGPGPWFDARFDGDCDTCFRHVDAGDEIRADGEGGYQCRACADEDEQQADDRPRKVRPKVPIENGRYRMPHPQTGKKWAGSRVTTFVKLASDHMALKLWELRTVLVGLTLSPDLVERVQELLENGLAHEETPSQTVKKARVPLDSLAEQAKTRAGASDRASKGTLLHKWAEEVDSGRRTVADVPEEHREDVAAHAQGMAAAGITVLPHLIERTTAVLGLGVIGTFDRVFRMPDGKYRVGDTKTGSLVYGQDEIAAQMAVYAHGCNETGIAEWDGEGNPRDWESWRWVPLTDEDGQPIRVEEDWGVVMHLPQGERVFQPYEADLVTGWRGAQLCNEVRAWHRVKSTLSPMPLPDPETPPESQLAPGDRMLARLAAEVGDPGTVADRIAQGTASLWTPEELAFWKPRAEAVTTAAEATRVFRAAVTARTTPEQRAELTARMREVLASRQAVTAAYPAVPDAADPSPQNGETLLQVAIRTAVRIWSPRFASVTGKEGALAAWREAKAAGVPKEALEELLEISRAELAKQANGDVPMPGIVQARPAPAAGNPPETLRKGSDQAHPEPSAPDWETAFAGVQDGDQALELWRRAKASGVTPARLDELTQAARNAIRALREAPPVVQAPEVPQGPTWGQRAAAVATREQASALYAEMRAPGSGLEREQILELLEVMKQVVPA